MFKIALNAGHSKNTAGKRCLKSLDANETREWVLNSRICNKIEDKLKAYDGYELIRLDDTTGETDVPLKDRTDKANAFKADIYLAIHADALGKGVAFSGGGITAFVYTQVDDETLEWQKDFYDAVIKHTGLKGNRATPLAKANLHECRESDMPAVLLECGFMDSSVDVPIILTDDFAEGVATGCVEVLVKKGGLKKKASAKPTQTATSTSSLKAGAKVVLDQVPLYATATAKTEAAKKTGTYFLWSNEVVKNRIRITNKKANVGVKNQVTGFVNVSDISKSATVTSKPTATSYLVRVTASSLNIRKGAGTNYAVVGTIKNFGIYTIVAESAGKGSTKGWGKLKSGAGWISLDYCKKV